MRAPSPPSSQPPPPISRRALLCGATATALASLILPADAKVDIDIERFGDKGLLLFCLVPLCLVFLLCTLTNTTADTLSLLQHNDKQS